MATQHKPGRKASRRQFAALPCTAGANGPMVMLVTSRGTGRWVLPKGWPKKHLTGSETAALEAFEEAGLVGDVAPDAVGLYHYPKRMPGGGTIRCDVDVFPMKVAELLEDWPERGQRQRKWFTLTEAARLVAEQDLTKLLLRLAMAGEKVLS